jgi:hypothetical protein
MSIADDAQTSSEWEREFLLARRQALLIELAAIEKRLGLKRSIASKRQRDSRRGDAEHDSLPSQIIA